jgi:hypothetical protein
MVPLFF